MIIMIVIKNNVLKEEMYYKNTMILSYKIEYPSFYNPKYQMSLNRINQYYNAKALSYRKYVKGIMYKTAVEQYEYSVANGFPIRPFEAIVVYIVTYNQDCAISLYSDRYEYMAGAHGNTTRISDTWNIQAGRRIHLSRLFAPSVDFVDYIVTEVNNQIAEEIKSGNDVYYENYEKDVRSKFNPNQFYLTEEGVVIYYQQYDIAPYSTGIPQFTIPYSDGVVLKPRCKRALES